MLSRAELTHLFTPKKQPITCRRNCQILRRDRPSSHLCPVTVALFCFSMPPPTAYLLHSKHCLWFFRRAAAWHISCQGIDEMTPSHERRPACLLPLLCWDRRAALSACLAPISHSQLEQSPHINWTPYHELVATKFGHAASQSVEIYQGQPPTARSHTARPEYNPALTRTPPHWWTKLMQWFIHAATCVCVCSSLASAHTHTGRVQAADVELNGSTVAFLCWRIDGWWQTGVVMRFLKKDNLLNWFICS